MKDEEGDGFDERRSRYVWDDGEIEVVQEGSVEAQTPLEPPRKPEA